MKNKYLAIYAIANFHYLREEYEIFIQQIYFKNNLFSSYYFKKHHCRGCGNIFCDSCTSQQSELTQLGYTGQQRVCQECFSRYNTGAKKRKRNRAKTLSPTIIEAPMTLTDSLGRPTQKFHFSLTNNSFRWYKHKEEKLSG